jgi:hypothetical protein
MQLAGTAALGAGAPCEYRRGPTPAAHYPVK